MFTAIVPTMQRSPFLAPLLDMLAGAELVAQVIVVNNSGRPLPGCPDGIEIIDEGRNLYVNPSWNRGVEAATQPRLAIINDDLVFAAPVFAAVAGRLDAGAGLIGLDLSCVRVEPENARPHFRPVAIRHYGFGSLMFLDRSAYVPIPDELLIWCGDDWLFERQTRSNYRLCGVPVRTQMGSTSTAPEFAAIKAADVARYDRDYRDWTQARAHPVRYLTQRATAIGASLPDRLRRRSLR